MKSLLTLAIALAISSSAPAAELPQAKEHTNSLGMKFLRVEPGEFQMGQLQTPIPAELRPLYRGRGRLDFLKDGDFDEKPIHTVRVTRPFYVGAFEVTNAQYELFDPTHRELRGKKGVSKNDDDAVVFVSWYEAQTFCQWLSDLEGLPYRLPTEAEWEYACRAGTSSNFFSGPLLPADFRKKGKDRPTRVGQTPPNPWGLHDVHGGVEEWCVDWYGPYPTEPQIDPVGYAQGDFRVLRGGSHSTHDYFTRSANRMGQVPAAKNQFMGFRVVLGELPPTKPLPLPAPPLHQRDVVQRDPAEVRQGPDRSQPYFRGPHKFVKIHREANGPLFAFHNHDPAIVECPNGDVLAMWYTCLSEGDRDLAQAASRLRWGETEWEPASPFFDVPDRNDHAPALWFDGKETIYHFTGVGACSGRGGMNVVVRSSKDSGATWSHPRIILPEFSGGHQLSEPVFRLRDNTIVLVVDGRRSLFMSRDEGLTWSNPGGDIRGIHAGVVELSDGRLLGFGRDDGESGTLPKSISSDGGKTFTYEPTDLPPVAGNQRLTLVRLAEGPLLLAGFADTGIDITDASGTTREVHGLYTALSFDEGKTWVHRRPVTDDGPGKAVECMSGGLFTLSGRNAEFKGYLAVCQSADGLIHLISSQQHYAFNLTWLKTPAPPLRYPEVALTHIVETFSGPKTLDHGGWVDYHSYQGTFTGNGRYRIVAHSHLSGINTIIGKGSFELNVGVENIDYFDPGPRVSEGMVIRVFDNRARVLQCAFKENGVFLTYNDLQPGDLPGGSEKPGEWLRHGKVELDAPPKAVRARFTWNERMNRLRVFYGLNGAEPTQELTSAEHGIRFGRPLSESTCAYLLMSNGTMELDHFEVVPRSE